MNHLPRYNDIGKYNGRFLTEELGKIKGLIPPLMPSDWTSMLGTGRMGNQMVKEQRLGLMGKSIKGNGKIWETLELNILLQRQKHRSKDCEWKTNKTITPLKNKPHHLL